MRKTLAAVAIAVYSVPACAQDTYVTSSDKYDYLVVDDTIRLTSEYGDKFAVAWEKHVRRDKSYRMVLNRYWCNDFKSTSVRSIEYSATGEVLNTYDFTSHRSKTFANDVIPRTIGATLLEYVCARAG